MRHFSALPRDLCRRRLQNTRFWRREPAQRQQTRRHEPAGLRLDVLHSSFFYGHRRDLRRERAHDGHYRDAPYEICRGEGRSHRAVMTVYIYSPYIHVHVCVVVQENNMDIYLDGKLVNSSSFEDKMLVAYYDQAITLGDDANFTASDSLSAGYMHSYQYIDRAITADELSTIYNSLMTSYSKVDKNSYSAKIYLTRDGNEIGGLAQRFTL